MKKLVTKIILTLFTLSVFGAFTGSALASDITSASFIIRDPVIGAGGGYGSSASFQLESSEDKVLTGAGGSASFLGRYGFLYFPSASSPSPSPSPSPTPTPNESVGSSPIARDNGCGTGNLNCDGHVGISDLSILLFYFGKTGTVITAYDLNHDNKIDIRDISIMFYYWNP